MSGLVRLQKYLSQAGIASRRAGEELILAGRVWVNGRVVSELGTKVDPAADVVQVDGRRVQPASRLWIAVHKPRGVVSTRRDPQGRRTVYDGLPRRFRALFHVGRLDLDSEGLMLLTNDGDGAHRLLHPRHGIERVYEVEIEGGLDRARRARLLGGIELEDGVARAHSVEQVSRTASGATLRLAVREGRKREVRRMLEALGRPVRKLVRLRFGPIELGNLAPGMWRALGPDELERIESVMREPRAR